MATVAAVAKSIVRKPHYNDSSLSSTDWGPGGRSASTIPGTNFRVSRTPRPDSTPFHQSVHNDSSRSVSTNSSFRNRPAQKLSHIHRELGLAADEIAQRRLRQVIAQREYGDHQSSSSSSIHLRSETSHSDQAQDDLPLGASASSFTPSHRTGAHPPTAFNGPGSSHGTLSTSAHNRGNSFYQRRTGGYRLPDTSTPTNSQVRNARIRDTMGRATKIGAPVAVAAGISNIVTSTMGIVERKHYENKKEQQRNEAKQTIKDAADKKAAYYDQHGIPLGIPLGLAPKTHQYTAGTVYKSKTAANPHSWAFNGSEQQQFYGTGELL